MIITVIELKELTRIMEYPPFNCLMDSIGVNTEIKLSEDGNSKDVTIRGGEDTLIVVIKTYLDKLNRDISEELKLSDLNEQHTGFGLVDDMQLIQKSNRLFGLVTFKRQIDRLIYLLSIAIDRSNDDDTLACYWRELNELK